MTLLPGRTSKCGADHRCGSGAANPRSEFNVIVGGAYHFAGEPLACISGNFFGFMPDGVTPYDMSTENATTLMFLPYRLHGGIWPFW